MKPEDLILIIDNKIENFLDKRRKKEEEKKAIYEEKKIQERKRRFPILSGNIKPIKTTFNLNKGEDVYFQSSAERLAEVEYIESHTTGQTKKKGVLRRSVVGGVLLGGVGAVIGGATAGDKIKSTTTQEKINRTEAVDTGTILFSNKRILFIGKEVLDISYDEILAVNFDIPYFEIKYPSMIKGENYKIDNLDAKLYFEGIMRLTKRNKTKILEPEVEIDWVDSSEQKKTNPLIRSAIIGFCIFLVFGTINAVAKPVVILLDVFILILIIFYGFEYKFGKNISVTQKKLMTGVLLWLLITLTIGLFVYNSFYQ